MEFKGYYSSSSTWSAGGFGFFIKLFYPVVNDVLILIFLLFKNTECFLMQEMVCWASLKNHLGSVLCWNDICEQIKNSKKAQNDSSFDIPSHY